MLHFVVMTLTFVGPVLQLETQPEAPQYDLAQSADISGLELYDPSLHVSHDCNVEVLPTPTIPPHPAGGIHHNFEDVSCENTILIQEDGSVEVKSVVCSDPVFERSTWSALEKMRWATRAIDGNLCAEVGTEVSYPIEYRFE